MRDADIETIEMENLKWQKENEKELAWAISQGYDPDDKIFEDYIQTTDDCDWIS